MNQSKGSAKPIQVPLQQHPHDKPMTSSLSMTASANDPSISHTLQNLLLEDGTKMLSDANQLRALLEARLGSGQPAVATLVQALDTGVPQALQRDASARHASQNALQAASLLMQHTAMPADTALWAAQTWQQGLGLDAAVPTHGAAPALAVAPALTAHPQNTGATNALPGLDKRWLAAGAAAAVALAGGIWWSLQPSLQIESVRSANPVLVGDGRPQPVVLNYNSRSTRPKTIEVRWVEGTARWPVTSWQVPVENATQPSGDISAGTLSYRTTSPAGPAKGTFEYTLVDRDGKRSASVQKTFEFLPPINVKGVRFASQPRPGQSALALVSYGRGAGDIVSAQTKVIESTSPWPTPEQTITLAPGAAPGSAELPFMPPAQAARSTLEVVLIDSLGVKSEPFVFNVNTGLQPTTSGPAVVVSVVQTASGETSGVGGVVGGVVGGAAGNQVGKGSGKTVATLLGAVGGAFVGNTIEGRIRGPAQWTTTVRFEDGNTRRLQTGFAPGWRAGERVNVTAGGQVSR